MELKDVTVVIPSSGRPDRQITYQQLPQWIRHRTRIAIPAQESGLYKKWGGSCLWLIPTSIKGISHTRRYLMSHCKTRYLLMIDDDMTFAYRPDMLENKLVALPPEDEKITELLLHWRELMGKYIHVGLGARQWNSWYDKPIYLCTRMFNTYMYDLEIVRQVNPKLGRVPVMEDFDLTLQLLRAGYKNAVIWQWCWNQAASNAPGGCSQYRTLELQEQAANKLVQLHPQFVKLRKAQADSWKGMYERIDVQVYWKKAYNSSLK